MSLALRRPDGLALAEQTIAEMEQKNLDNSFESRVFFEAVAQTDRTRAIALWKQLLGTSGLDNVSPNSAAVALSFLKDIEPGTCDDIVGMLSGESFYVVADRWRWR